jgi:hypothetical protein
MNRNQKIGIGCGAIGCLGLIGVCIAGGLIYFLNFQRTAGRSDSYNSKTNLNANANRNSNANGNTNKPTNSASSNSANETASSMSDDAKHKLFQAAGMLKEPEVMQEVLKQIGKVTAKGVPTAEYGAFLKDHILWARQNESFINSVNTEETAREYVKTHLAD